MKSRGWSFSSESIHTKPSVTILIYTSTFIFIEKLTRLIGTFEGEENTTVFLLNNVHPRISQLTSSLMYCSNVCTLLTWFSFSNPPGHVPCGYPRYSALTTFSSTKNTSIFNGYFTIGGEVNLFSLVNNERWHVQFEIRLMPYYLHQFLPQM